MAEKKSKPEGMRIQLKGLRTKNDDQKTGIEIVRKAIQTPARQIAHNAGEDGSVIVGKLLEKPVTFLAKNPRTLADIYADIELLGRITGRSVAAARVARAMQRELSRIAARSRARHDGKPRPRVYCEAWSNPRISSPPWVAELTRIAGGDFVVPAGQRVTDDEVAQAAPDVIVLAWAAVGSKSKPQSALRNPAWQSVPAVRARRVYAIRDELLNTPAPILLRGAKELFRVLHS